MSVIDRDLSALILEEEYPRLLKNIQEFLDAKVSEMRHEAVMLAIAEAPNHTFTASRILARLNEDFGNFMDVQYDTVFSQLRERALTELEKITKKEKRKATITQGHVNDYISNHFGKEVRPLKRRKRQFERDIEVMKSLHKRCENKESLLQTYTRLLEKRHEFISKEK